MVIEQTLSELKGMRHTAGVVLIAALQRILPRIEALELNADDVSFELRFTLDVPLPAEMLSEVEREMISILREQPLIESTETLACNAADYFSHQGQNILAEKLRMSGKQLIPIVRLGSMMFPCKTPHELDPNLIGAVKLLSVSYDAETCLSTISGTAFSDRRELRKFLKRYELAKECDHRRLAQHLQLFGVYRAPQGEEWFWLPKGAIIRDQLLLWWRAEISSKGFTPVSYISNDEPAVTHARIYATVLHVAQEMPQRYCEITEHRHTPSRPCGLLDSNAYRADALSVFCRADQVLNELKFLLEIMLHTVSLFDLTYEFRLSGKHIWLPELLQSLDITYLQTEGPSQQETNLEILCEDAIGRRWLGPRLTIHHQLPKRERLNFQSADGDSRTPIQLTISCFSSIERFTALLLEHFSGCLPTWLAPEQIRIIPISERHIDYCQQVRNTIAHRHLRVGIDLRHETLSTRVFAAENGRVPYVLVIGDQEEREGCITVRESRLGTVTHGVSLTAFLERVQEESRQRSTAHKHKPLRKDD